MNERPDMKAASESLDFTLNAPQMTRDACEARSYPHNQRCRFTTGFYCEDCSAWIPNADERWYFTNRYGRRQERR